MLRACCVASRMDEVHHEIVLASQRLEGRFEVAIFRHPSGIRTNGAGQRKTSRSVDVRLNRPAIALGQWHVAGRLDVLADGRTHHDIPVGICG